MLITINLEGQKCTRTYLSVKIVPTIDDIND